MECFVYILRLVAGGGLYVGHTGDLTRRLAQHNDPHAKSYTGKRGPWAVAYSEVCPDRSTAMARERFLKSCAGAHEKKMLAGLITGVERPEGQVSGSSRSEAKVP